MDAVRATILLIVWLTCWAPLAEAQLRSPASYFPQESPEHQPGMVPSDSVAPEGGRPWLSFPLAVALGTGGGAAGLIAGYLSGCSDEGSHCSFGIDHGEYYLGLVGVTLGSTVGAHLGGLRRESTGTFGATLLAAALGTLPGLLAPKSDANLMALLPLLTSPLAATIVDHSARRQRHRRIRS